MALALLAGCGGSGSHTKTPAHPKRAARPPARKQQAPTPVHRARARDVAIVRAWADSLRAGHVAKASSYFSLPAIVQNGGEPFRLTTHTAVRVFNEALPCGARVVRAIRGARYTVVTFKLTERRRSRVACGTGVGQLAATAFAFRHGEISEWRRVLVPPAAQTV